MISSTPLDQGIVIGQQQQRAPRKAQRPPASAAGSAELVQQSQDSELGLEGLTIESNIVYTHEAR